MLFNPIFRESLERAKSQNLEAIIQGLSGQEDKRNPSRKQIEQRRAALLRQIKDTTVASARLERILRGNELSDISYLARGVQCARSVCRVVINRKDRLEGYGTGFLVAPGVLLTNRHVLPSVDNVRGSIAQFRYERGLDGRELKSVDFALSIASEPILFKDLDMALVAVEPQSVNGKQLEQFGWLKLNPQPGKAFIGEYLTIIQHPKGEHKQVCVRENKLLKYSDNGPYIWYQTDTVGGSSGSPVFNNSWEVVALHHSSVPRTKRINGKDVLLAANGKPWTDKMGDDQLRWIANEGVRISRIVQYLQSQHGGSPLARKALIVGEPKVEEVFKNGEGSEKMKVQTDGDGTTRIWVPVEIRVAANNSIVYPTPQEEPFDDFVILHPPPALEKIIINQNNYDERNGYDPAFLGKGFAVPLPRVVSNKFGKPLTVRNKNHELKYWNNSIVMNKTRRLAFFSAANVDPGRFQGKRDADGDKWYLDTRVAEIDKNAQVGTEFYKKQRQFEADRTSSPFDQGHLTSREHLQWGDNDKEAKRNGDDSYHYTNCAPQHWQFNENKKANGLWFRLEQTAINNLGNGTRLCTISGPVFDAPLCKPGYDGKLRLDLKGKRVQDGSFGGVNIPKLFFKIIAYRVEKKLRSKAFVVTQEDLLKTIDRYYPAEASKKQWLSDLEVRLYQLKIADLEKLTGLDFGTLSKCDAPVGTESLTLAQGLPIEDEHEIVF